MKQTNLAKAESKKLKVLSIKGGHMLLKKLRSMGIYEGSVIEKVISYNKGPVIIKIMNSQVAIGRGMAEKIMVEEIK